MPEGYIIPATQPVTSYTDSLQTTEPNPPPNSQVFLDSAKWMYKRSSPSGSTWTNIAWDSYTIGPANDGQNALLWQNSGVANPTAVMRSHLIPITPYVAVYSKIQFCQCTMVFTSNQSPNGSLRAGLEVMHDAAYAGVAGSTNDLNCSSYTFNVLSDDKSWQSARINGLNVTVLGSGTGMANADTYRESADPTTPGQTTVTITRNGTVLFQSIDSSLNRLNKGIFALHGIATTGTISPEHSWRNFSCGLGL